MRLSVVMPTMNEEQAISKVVSEIKKHLCNGDEILIVDSSKDKTPQIAQTLGVRVIRQKPMGAGLALREGLLAARGDVSITMDCDGSYPAQDIPRFVELIQSGYHIVSGNRLNERNQSMPVINKLGNWVFASLVRSLYDIKTKDITTGMRAYTKEVVHSTQWEANYAFPAEIVIRSTLKGYRYEEVDIDYRQRIGEVTLNRWRSGKAYLRCIFKYRLGLKIHPDLL